MVVELVLEGVAGAAAAGALRAATLDHELGDDPVEDQGVVEAVGGELAEVLDRLRGVVVVQLDDDRASAGVEGGSRHPRTPYRPATRTVTGAEAPGA